MKNLTSFLGRILPLAIVCSLSITSALAQQSQVQIVRADINGNEVNMYLDHDSLQRFLNQVVGAMDSDVDGSLLEWSDVLSNGNNPGMNVNFSGYSVFGIDSLTSTGVLLADSLVLNKDAEITGKLILGDSLAVAGATTFSGDVKGLKATGDDEFVTYFQLDSLANQAPYNETYIVTKKDDTFVQTITVGGGEQEVQIMPSPVPLYLGFVVDMSDAVQALGADGISNNEPISLLASGGPSSSTQAFSLKEAGMYESTLTLQVSNPNASDAMVTLSLMNYDPGTQSIWDNPRVLSCATEVVYGQYGANVAFNIPVHFNMASTFKMDNENEDVYLLIETVGADVVIQSFAFSVTRSGE